MKSMIDIDPKKDKIAKTQFETLYREHQKRQGDDDLCEGNVPGRGWVTTIDGRNVTLPTVDHGVDVCGDELE